MSERIDEEMLLRRYLLGDLDEASQEQVEDHLLSDDDFAGRLYMAQDHLIDDYVFDALAEREREMFEKNFILDDERHRKFLFAHAMERYLDKESARNSTTRDDSPGRPSRWKGPFLFIREHKAWAGLSLAVTLLLIFLAPKIGMWLQSNHRATPQQAQRESKERQIAELNKRPPEALNQAGPSYELSLQPTLLREGGKTNQAVLTEDIKLLNLQLKLPPVQYESYRALISTVEGTELFAIADLKPAAGTSVPTIVLRIPPEFLPTADYQVDLKGNNADGRIVGVARYNFRVINNRPSK